MDRDGCALRGTWVERGACEILSDTGGGGVGRPEDADRRGGGLSARRAEERGCSRAERLGRNLVADSSASGAVRRVRVPSRTERGVRRRSDVRAGPVRRCWRRKSRSPPITRTTTVAASMIGNRFTSGYATLMARSRRAVLFSSAIRLWPSGTPTNRISGGCTMAVKRALLPAATTARTQPRK